MAQQGDVVLCQTPDDGDISVVNGVVEMSGGLETAVYLSLFGGNEDDDGREQNAFTWWGNIDELEPDKQYHSETQNLLKSLPATSINLRRIESAAERDLNWLTQGSIASSVEIVVTIPSFNNVAIDIKIQAQGEEINFNFVENWKAAL